MSSFHELKATSIDGESVDFARFRGHPVVIVNVASRCGYTPQYAGLEELQQAYGPRGVAILGFPCNQFGAQEPGTDADIAQFCSTNYEVTFPMFSKVEVNGPGAHPLYQWLTAQPEGAGDIGWNFTKFIVDGEGRVVGRYPPGTAPGELAETLDQLLA